MAQPPTHDVVVIGAGIAGLTAARSVRAAGASVVVLEKSRGFGGRAASRTVHGVRVDHGAQFISVRDARFRAQVDAWLDDGTLREWTRVLERWTATDGWQPSSPDGHPRYAAPSGMNAVGKALAVGIDVARETHAHAVRRDGDAWTVDAADGRRWRAATVVLSAPVPQALALLPDDLVASPRARDLATLRFEPCHAVIVHAADQAPPRFAGAQLPEHPDLAWIGNDGSRRGSATGTGATVVLHATPSFTRRAFDAPAEQVVAHLLRAAEPILEWSGPPTWTLHHRWRYARPERSWPTPALDLGDGIVMGGDAFGDGRVEGAYLSGLAAAAAIAS